jgi:glyoxylase-like metal-dependent hydrolase (beta-lactamase superfamily II)
MNQITIGDVTITRIEEMHGPIMPPAHFFPTIPESSWDTHREMLVPHHLDDSGEMVHVAMQPWLVRSGGKTILIDTGVGNDKTRPAVPVWDHMDLDFLGALAAAGVRPEDVDIVVNTHLHVDHVGWNTRLRDGEWVPTFPNARYLMPRADFEFWNPANNPNVAGGVNEYVFEDSVAPVYAAGQVDLWEGEYTIDESLRLEAAPGHTPGSSVITLTSGSDRAIFAGDLMHSPIQVFETDHHSCFCEDTLQAAETRRKFLSWAADHNALVLPAHFSGHGALEVERRGDRFAIREWAAFDRL